MLIVVGALLATDDGMTIMVGGFPSCGTPQKLVDDLGEIGALDMFSGNTQVEKLVE